MRWLTLCGNGEAGRRGGIYVESSDVLDVGILRDAEVKVGDFASKDAGREIFRAQLRHFVKTPAIIRARLAPRRQRPCLRWWLQAHRETSQDSCHLHPPSSSPTTTDMPPAAASGTPSSGTTPPDRTRPSSASSATKRPPRRDWPKTASPTCTSSRQTSRTRAPSRRRLTRPRNSRAARSTC